MCLCLFLVVVAGFFLFFSFFLKLFFLLTIMLWKYVSYGAKENAV